MARLTPSDRRALPKSDFALPERAGTAKGKAAGGSYPIPDKAHARNALARVAQHGTPAEKAEVRRRVHERYPDIGEHADSLHPVRRR